MKAEDFGIVWLCLAAFPTLVWSPLLDDSGGRLSWDKEGSVCVPFSLFSIRLAVLLRYQLMVSAPKGTPYKELEMLLGTGIEDFGSQQPNSEEEVGQWCCFRVLGFFLMPCALVYLAQRLKGHFYFDP